MNPELLLHPNIPKPLHGLAPRVIKGDEWWNLKRQAAYLTNDYKCWACDVHKRNALYHSWLEAHEIYKIDYLTGKVEFEGVCALCHSCHNFIHSGRLYSMLNKGEIDKQKVIDILKRGFEVLRANQLKMNPFALTIAERISKTLFTEYKKYGVHQYEICLVEWGDWRLVLEGKEYKGKFESFEDWEDYYR